MSMFLRSLIWTGRHQPVSRWAVGYSMVGAVTWCSTPCSHPSTPDRSRVCLGT